MRCLCVGGGERFEKRDIGILFRSKPLDADSVVALDMQASQSPLAPYQLVAEQVRALQTPPAFSMSERTDPMEAVSIALRSEIAPVLSVLNSFAPHDETISTEEAIPAKLCSANGNCHVSHA